MKPKLFAMSLFLLLALAVVWSAQSQPTADLERLPPGGWTLVERESGQALLAPKVRFNPKVAGKAAAPSAHALLIAPDASPSIIPARTRGLFVPGRNSRPQVWSTQFMGRKVLFSPVGNGPALRGVPGRPGDYVFSADGTIWGIQSGRAPQRLAADSVDEFSRESLLKAGTAAEREGGGLIWAADPLASFEGSLVAYVTNRESFPAGPAGQSVWLVESATGHERALLFRSGESFTPLAWLGDELLFTGNAGGISAIDPATGEVRQVGSGTLLAADSHSEAIATLEGNLARNRRLVITRPDGKSKVARFAGYEYAGNADFSPDGTRLAVVLSAMDGRKQVQIIDVSTGQSELLPLPDTRRAALTDPPRWVDDHTLLITTGLRRSGEERSSLLSVPASAR